MTLTSTSASLITASVASSSALNSPYKVSASKAYKLGFYRDISNAIMNRFDAAVDAFFRRIINNSSHIMTPLLHERLSNHAVQFLCSRHHDFLLIIKSWKLKVVYWTGCKLTFQLTIVLSSVCCVKTVISFFVQWCMTPLYDSICSLAVCQSFY